MPVTDVIFYRELDGSVPVLGWLQELERRNRRAAEKCIAQMEVLHQLGNERRRPLADYLRDGVYELRVRVGRSQHRILYFFHRRNAAAFVHGLTKERIVPPRDIERALARMQLFKKNPALHSHRKGVI
jgi:phage-related protein